MGQVIIHYSDLDGVIYSIIMSLAHDVLALEAGIVVLIFTRISHI